MPGARPLKLASGADARITGELGAPAVVCVNGGQAAQVAGTWSASLEWLVRRLAPRRPDLAFVEVRYRVKSWNRFELCVEDCRAAIEAAGAERTLLLGFSMGGAVAIASAAEPSVEGVLGLAPWIHDRLPLDTLADRRLDVLHGSLDRSLPGIPGVSPALSYRGFERARAAGVPGSYEVIPRALHAIALRSRGGRPLPLPRARVWAERVEARLAAFPSGA